MNGFFMKDGIKHLVFNCLNKCDDAIVIQVEYKFQKCKCESCGAEYKVRCYKKNNGVTVERIDI